MTFQIQLSNDGTVPIRRIVLRDQLPPGLLYPRGYVIEADVGDLRPANRERFALMRRPRRWDVSSTKSSPQRPVDYESHRSARWKSSRRRKRSRAAVPRSRLDARATGKDSKLLENNCQETGSRVC